MGERPLLCNVVKGNAYGMASAPFVPLAQQLGMDRFAVYSASEAYDLLQVVEGAHGLHHGRRGRRGP